MNKEEPRLSDDQLAALAPGVQHIEAGPGAGKTKTVVARFRRLADQGLGVALLSFTNVAVDVARSRCRHRSTLIEPPNFIGTFDQFFHRYVVTPDVHRRFGVSPRYISSWDDLPDHLAVVRPRTGGTGFRLSRFARTDSRTWAVDEMRLSRSEKFGWGKLAAWSRERINQEGTRRIDSFYREHLYDTVASRARAVTALTNVDTRYLSLLRTRFAEIIVDEFQDCDTLEHQLVDLLRSAGIHVVTVADPDQAIYEFRHATSGLYERYRNRLALDSVATLRTCYRSAPAICALTSSLRCVGLDPIEADPEHTGGADVIHVVAGSGTTAGNTALAIIGRHGVSMTHTRVVAHRRYDARALVQASRQPPQGTSQMQSLLVPLAELRTPSSPRVRLAAAKLVEAFILHQLQWSDNGPATKNERLEHLGVAPERLRIVVSRLLSASWGWNTSQECSASVRVVLTEFAAEFRLKLAPTLGRRLIVQPVVWSFWESLDGSVAVAEDPRSRSTHIHAIKGDEFPGVVLALPTNAPAGLPHVLDDWEAGRNSEQRRVLYVGASRASKVLVVVVPHSRKDQLIRILADARVPHQTTSIR